MPSSTRAISTRPDRRRYKHDIRNCWWIVDYNRQSLDATSADRMFERFDEIFRRMRLAHRRTSLRQETYRQRWPSTRPSPDWLDALPNADMQRLALSGRRGLASADRCRFGQEGRRLPQGARRRGARRLDERPWRTLHGIADRGVRRRAGRCADIVRRLDGQGLRPAVCRPQGQSRRADEPDPGPCHARRDGHCRGRRMGAACRDRRQ